MVTSSEWVIGLGGSNQMSIVFFTSPNSTAAALVTASRRHAKKDAFQHTVEQLEPSYRLWLSALCLHVGYCKNAWHNLHLNYPADTFRLSVTSEVTYSRIYEDFLGLQFQLGPVLTTCTCYSHLAIAR